MENNLIRGDSCVIEFTISDEQGKHINIEDIDTLYLTARKVADSKILFSKKKEDFNLENNVYTVEILPTDTEEFKITEFEFDIEITLLDGTRQSKTGKINLDYDFTTHKGGAVNEN